MDKLILNFKSKISKKIKNPKTFLGGKGANLSEMGRMGLSVPSGFTISTKVCDLFYKNKKKLNLKIIQNIKEELKIIEKETGKKFGDLKNPLLVSVRSGARVSMPGMMDTILNLGLNDKTVLALANKTSNIKSLAEEVKKLRTMEDQITLQEEALKSSKRELEVVSAEIIPTMLSEMAEDTLLSAGGPGWRLAGATPAIGN